MSGIDPVEIFVVQVFFKKPYAVPSVSQTQTQETETSWLLLFFIETG